MSEKNTPILYKSGIGWVWGNNVIVSQEYDRDQWKHWIDADGDCQKTRDEILIAESEIAVTLSDDGCKVVEGRWTGPFTGEVFTKPDDVDVDHMVPLKNAHRSGGWLWSKQKRKEYANDMSHPEHLIVVKDNANQSKGARGPGKWKPPLESYWCQYAKDWEAIKQHWGLNMVVAEAEAVQEMKATCP